MSALCRVQPFLSLQPALPLTCALSVQRAVCVATVGVGTEAARGDGTPPPGTYIYVCVYTDNYVIDLASSERFGLVVIRQRIARETQRQAESSRASTDVTSVHATSFVAFE